MRNAWKTVLKALVERSGYCHTHELPNGHGHCIGNTHAKSRTLLELEYEGYVKHGERENPPVMGWAITPAGRLALSEHEGK